MTTILYLRDVTRLAKRAAATQEALDDAIVAARQAGVPIRAIAQAAGTSHPQILRLLARREVTVTPPE